MAKPINILTGLDYWLDNLMCNVPEVVMVCYLYRIFSGGGVEFLNFHLTVLSFGWSGPKI